MAKQQGIIKIKGTVGGLTFYNTQDGNLVREKGGIEKQRILNDPNFVRTRENMSEFGSSASSGKLFRNTFRSLMLNASDNRVASRVTKLMTEIKNLDTFSGRGFRNVGIGISNAAAPTLIKGFDFNAKSPLSTVFYGTYVLTTGTGDVNISNFTPANDLNYPQGATHVQLKSAIASIDFVAGTSEIQYSNPQVMSIDNFSSSFHLTPTAVPTIPGNMVYLMSLEFFQEVNGNLYSLKNGAYNVLNVLDFV